MVTPATRKRGGNPDVPPKTKPREGAARHTSHRAERALEEGLEEFMAGSDPPIVQPGKNFTDSK